MSGDGNRDRNPAEVRSLPGEVWSLIAGTVRHPVETYEGIARGEGAVPRPEAGLAFVGLLATAGGLWTALAPSRLGGGLVPASAAFLVVALAMVFGVYLAASTVIWLVMHILGGRGCFGAVLTAWAASYVPTAVWFGGLLLAHVVFAPGSPFKAAASGGSGYLAFQIVFLVFSIAVFLWKALLLYLTLRVVGGLDFRRIVAAALILAPVALGYWALGLHFGWFKVPAI